MTTEYENMAALMDPRLGTVQLGAVAYPGFPVRKITRKLNSNSGEWVIAYQADQRKHLQAVIVPLVREHITHHGSKILRPPTNTREASGLPRKTLDQSFLLKHCYGQEPGDLCVCNVSGEEIQDYKADDFVRFENVVSINASDNHLPLEAFHTFPALEELELSLNGIVDVAIETGHMTKLTTLDLSYNSLSEWALLALGTLPQLKELHLTGNNIVALPVEMSRPYPSPNQSSAMEIRYPCLEKLWLDDNKLTDQSTFATLAGMRRLRYLNLDNNEVYMIPHLKLLGTSPLKAAKSPGQPSTASSYLQDTTTPDLIHSRSTLPVSQDGDQSFSGELAVNMGPSFVEEGERMEKSQDPRPVENACSDSAKEGVSKEVGNEGVASVKGSDSVELLQKNLPDSEISYRGATESTTIPQTPPPSYDIPLPLSAAQTDQSAPVNPKCDTPEEKRRVKRGSRLEPVAGTDEEKLKQLAPFPKLETLSLVNNMILREEGVVACCTWPVLKELIIYDNPLTRNLKGMPPLLKSHLVDQCGVKVVRKKPSLQKRPLIGKSAKDFKKVSSAPPPVIPKYPLPALEAPPMSSSALNMIEGSSPFSRSQSPSSHCSFNRSDSQASYFSQSQSGSCDASDGGSSESGASDAAAGMAAVKTGGTASVKERDNLGKEKDSQSVFLTQVDGEEPTEMSTRHCHVEGVVAPPTDQSSVGETFRARKRELRNKYKDLPSRYKGYEVLMETFEDKAMNVPHDVYGCTRALQHALKHPLVLSDSSSNSPSVSSHSGSSQAQVTGNYLKKKVQVMALVPTAGQTNHKVRQLQEVLDEVRTQCNTLETNVASVLDHGSGEGSAGSNGASVMCEGRRSIAELQKESKKLLAEMQARYDQVRAQSLSSVQAMSLELQRHSGTPSRRKRTPKSTARVTFSSEGTV